MSISTSSSFFTSPNPHFNSHTASKPIPSSVTIPRARVSAVFTSAAKETSLYEVLGVGVGANTAVVKAAYRRLARVLHPDVGSSESSAAEFMKVHSAYTTLVDPEKRAAYDRSLAHTRTGVSTLVGFSGGYKYKPRRWETDQCW